MKINLNNELFWVSKFEYGKTTEIEIKIGHEWFLVDIEKDSICTHIEVYKKTSDKVSKYDSEFFCQTTVKSTAILNRDFFENIKKIQEAELFLQKYEQCLHR